MFHILRERGRWDGRVLRSRSFLLLLEESQERDVGDLDHLESDSRNISDGVAGAPESRHQHFVVLLDVIETTVLRDESRDLLAILDELNSDAFPNGRVGLFGFDADLLQHDSLDVRSASERIGLQRGSRMRLLVILVRPSLHATMRANFTRGFESTWFSHLLLILFFFLFSDFK